MEARGKGNCLLLVKLVISVIGTSLREEDWANGDESTDLECEVGEFFYFKYQHLFCHL